MSQDMANTTTIVVGASRGLGRGIATALADAGAPVIAVARSADTLARSNNETIRTEVGDAADPTLPGRLLDRYDPRAVVLVAGAARVRIAVATLGVAPDWKAAVASLSWTVKAAAACVFTL